MHPVPGCPQFACAAKSQIVAFCNMCDMYDCRMTALSLLRIQMQPMTQLVMLNRRGSQTPTTTVHNASRSCTACWAAAWWVCAAVCTEGLLKIGSHARPATYEFSLAMGWLLERSCMLEIVAGSALAVFQGGAGLRCTVLYCACI